MVGHKGGETSKFSCDLNKINRQLKSGKTLRGIDLDKTPGKREKLEEEKAAILAKMQEAKDRRHDERMKAIMEHTAAIGEKTTKDVNSHSTAESDRVISAVTSLVRSNTQPNPDQTRMAAKLASSSTTASVLNSILTAEGMSTKGTKEEKAALLATSVPVHKLLAMTAERAPALAVPRPSPIGEEQTTAENNVSEEAMCDKLERLIERNGRKITEVIYVFKEGKCPKGCNPGDEFGVKQFVGIFTEDELRGFERSVDEMLEHDEWWLENTLDVSPKEAIGAKKQRRERTKHFFPQYTYGGGHTPQLGDCGPTPLQPLQKCTKCGGAQAIVTEKCNDIPDWIYHPEQPCLAKTLIELGIIDDAWANSAILNTYHKRGGKLGAHTDSCHLFERPIVGLSLFGAKSLSFGLVGQGMKAAEHHYTVEQQRGMVTIVYGYAANKINHGVRWVRHKACTLLLRRVFPILLSPEWKEKNTMRCKIEGSAPAEILDRVDDMDGQDPAPCSAAAPAAESKAGTQQSLLSGACVIMFLIRASVLSRHALRLCSRA